MNECCPVCSVKFERETGFFMMSIFVGEVLAAVLAVPFLILAWLLDLELIGLILAPLLAVLVLTPLIFRYSRLIWLYIDHLLDPRRWEQVE